MNILKHEIKMYRKSTLTWIISLIFVVVMCALIFPTVRDSAGVMNDALSAFPEGLRSALGISVLDLSEALGFFGFLFMYITLIGAIQGMNLGLSILSVELRDKTADFLFAKPVKRKTIIFSKLGAALLSLLFTNVVFIIVSKLILDSMGETSYSFEIFASFMMSLLFIQLFFLSLGMLMSVFMNRLKTVLPISLGVVFSFFILNLLNESFAEKPLTALTPFAYFSTSNIYTNKGFELEWLILNFVLVLLFSIGTYIRYIKKDIPSV